MGNSAVLKETALIEAFNLKAAIEFQMKNYDAAREALSDMPPRGEGSGSTLCGASGTLTMAIPYHCRTTHQARRSSTRCRCTTRRS